MNKIKVYIPTDFSSIALGADEVCDLIEIEAVKRNIPIKIVRNGSRGLYWLEPLVEVETPSGRIAYGPIKPSDVVSLFEIEFWKGVREHPLYLGNVEEIPYLKKQTRLTFERVGIIDPLSIEDYIARGGFQALKKALGMEPATVIKEVKRSGLRGRGGAGFPTGIKWETVYKTPSDKKYIVCNADEGDSGTFSDRMVMEGDPYLLIEGMIIAGLAVGADEGYIYLRSEYPIARKILEKAIEKAYREGYLGDDILGTGKKFHLEVYIGAGSYVCGEETALLESLEGKRGLVRPRPPLPAVQGLWDKPTVVNNVITLATVPWIVREGGEAYAEYGYERSRGTLPIQLSGNVKFPGLVEVPFGVSLRDIVYKFGGGTRTGKDVKAVQVGGPLGAYIPESKLDLPIDYESFSKAGAVLGHGGIVVFDEDADMEYLAKYSMEFCAKESCGKCTPCRIGSVRATEILDRLKQNGNSRKDIELMVDLMETMMFTSLCGLGGMAPIPILSIFKHFPDELGIDFNEFMKLYEERFGNN